MATASRWSTCGSAAPICRSRTARRCTSACRPNVSAKPPNSAPRAARRRRRSGPGPIARRPCSSPTPIRRPSRSAATATANATAVRRGLRQGSGLLRVLPVDDGLRARAEGQRHPLPAAAGFRTSSASSASAAGQAAGAAAAEAGRRRRPAVRFARLLTRSRSGEVVPHEVHRVRRLPHRRRHLFVLEGILFAASPAWDAQGDEERAGGRPDHTPARRSVSVSAVGGLVRIWFVRGTVARTFRQREVAAAGSDVSLDCPLQDACAGANPVARRHAGGRCRIPESCFGESIRHDRCDSALSRRLRPLSRLDLPIGGWCCYCASAPALARGPDGIADVAER